MTHIQLFKELKKHSRHEKAVALSRFFKTGKGEYGEGDKFIGVKVPDQRKVAKQFLELPFGELSKAIKSGIHEHRLTALLILTYKYEKASDKEKQKIFDFYFKNIKYVNNWDLVDLSAPKIVGNYLLDKDRKILFKLAKSDNLWERRISIISTAEFIRNMDFSTTLKISEILLNDEHDLIHKAVGWMLREVGKKDRSVEKEFLDKYHKEMPRTMLRYSIERFSQEEREHYMRR